MRRRCIISAISVFLLLVMLTSPSAGQRRRRRPAPPPKPAQLTHLPPSVLNAKLRDVEGRSFSLSTYSGKVLVVTLWATWCGPCRMQLNALNELHQEFNVLGLEVVGLTTENPKVSTETVRRFVKEFSLPFKNGWATNKVTLTLMQGRDAIPQTFVVSRTGRITQRFIGFAPDKTQSQIRHAIEEALEEESKLPD